MLKKVLAAALALFVTIHAAIPAHAHDLWYLVIPPSISPDEADTKAPLSEWATDHAPFPDEISCLEYLNLVKEVARDPDSVNFIVSDKDPYKPPEFQPPRFDAKRDFSMKLMRTRAESSRCVTPRLHGSFRGTCGSPACMVR
jgi:hypothetical protein